jgi:hypothetical protein
VLIDFGLAGWDAIEMGILDSCTYPLDERLLVFGPAIEHILRHGDVPFRRWIVTSRPYLLDTTQCSGISA